METLEGEDGVSCFTIRFACDLRPSSCTRHTGRRPRGGHRIPKKKGTGRGGEFFGARAPLDGPFRPPWRRRAAGRPRRGRAASSTAPCSASWRSARCSRAKQGVHTQWMTCMRPPSSLSLRLPRSSAPVDADAHPSHPAAASRACCCPPRRATSRCPCSAWSPPSPLRALGIVSRPKGRSSLSTVHVHGHDLRAPRMDGPWCKCERTWQLRGSRRAIGARALAAPSRAHQSGRGRPKTQSGSSRRPHLQMPSNLR